jgi:hypothetical protein
MPKAQNLDLRGYTVKQIATTMLNTPPIAKPKKKKKHK